MPAKERGKKSKDLTRLEWIIASGHEANVTAAVLPTNRPRSRKWLIELTNEAKELAPDFGGLAVLFLQFHVWEKTLTQTGEKLRNPLAPEPYQELLYELINLKPLVSPQIDDDCEYCVSLALTVPEMDLLKQLMVGMEPKDYNPFGLVVAQSLAGKVIEELDERC